MNKENITFNFKYHLKYRKNSILLGIEPLNRKLRNPKIRWFLSTRIFTPFPTINKNEISCKVELKYIYFAKNI